MVSTTRYCAEPTASETTSYCQHHYDRCYKRGTASGRKFPISLPVDKLPATPVVEPSYYIPDLVEASHG